MFTIYDDQSIQFEIKKSKFLSFLIRCDDESLVKNHIADISENFEGATHYCYAYIIDGKEKAYDDGEPSGTAGLPILNVLKKNNLTNVVCVVVRYFGGIKLGAGGLLRAYSKAASEVLKNSTITNYSKKVCVSISFEYDVVSKIDYILKDIEVTKSFDELITYNFSVDENFDLSIFDNLVQQKRVY